MWHIQWGLTLRGGRKREFDIEWRLEQGRAGWRLTLKASVQNYKLYVYVLTNSIIRISKKKHLRDITRGEKWAFTDSAEMSLQEWEFHALYIHWADIRLTSPSSPRVRSCFLAYLVLCFFVHWVLFCFLTKIELEQALSTQVANKNSLPRPANNAFRSNSTRVSFHSDSLRADQ